MSTGYTGDVPVHGPATGDQLLIDAADEADVLLGLAGSAGLTKVVTTHGHDDHWQALAEVAGKTGAQPADAPHIPVATDCPVRDGDRIRFGDVELTVTHLAGHTAGSIALSYEEPEGIVHGFTGDVLFPGGVGKTTTNRSPCCWRVSRASSSTPIRTAPGSTPVTAPSPHSVPNGRNWRNGAVAAGKRRISALCT
ncbi:hypothetical protein ATK36_4374 [Amycolatopsis sulphurea]|uniref:Metallo-beta-lactamase domain-containing protein n=1 Tax=Amycolatopsis sulphurea TaxID=76022 RepID=A0A2A9FCZ6_9PSEU|nr:MBL fold metallo-hydrolase [Amycolatopsis sulphurea]PFG49234.1 hypothetical protein ATK36_4374 [Amycolatopsis sulphurea]